MQNNDFKFVTMFHSLADILNIKRLTFNKRSCVLASIVILHTLLFTTLASAEQVDPGFQHRSITINGTDHKYQLYIPDNYNESKQWPVTLFLHGAGERGSDGQKQVTVGLPNEIRTHPERWPTIAVFPQVPLNQVWQGEAGVVAMAALNAAIAEFSVDESRIYLTGLSLGGNGTWYLGYNNPEKFAALVPVCGFVQLDKRMPPFIKQSKNGPYADIANKLDSTPVWIFHGDADAVVPVEESRKMAAALKVNNPDSHYSELPGVRHNAWVKAYANEELPTWMFKQRKSMN